MAKELIKSLGGSAAVARDLGVNPDAVRQWPKRGVPVGTRYRMALLAAERGVALPVDFWADKPGKETNP